MATTVMASSMAKEARNTSTAGTDKTYSNRRSKENKCSDDMPSTEGKVCTMKSIYHRSE